MNKHGPIANNTPKKGKKKEEISLRRKDLQLLYFISFSLSHFIIETPLLLLLFLLRLLLLLLGAR